MSQRPYELHRPSARNPERLPRAILARLASLTDPETRLRVRALPLAILRNPRPHSTYAQVSSIPLCSQGVTTP